MQKTKLFVTASAVCFALAGAAFSEGKSESALIYVAGKYNNTCFAGTQVLPGTGDCSILGGGDRCWVYVTDSWGNSEWVPGYGSPIVTNLCLLELKRP